MKKKSEPKECICYKYELYPTKEQRRYIEENIVCHQRVYNEALRYINDKNNKAYIKKLKELGGQPLLRENGQERRDNYGMKYVREELYKIICAQYEVEPVYENKKFKIYERDENGRCVKDGKGNKIVIGEEIRPVFMEAKTSKILKELDKEYLKARNLSAFKNLHDYCGIEKTKRLSTSYFTGEKNKHHRYYKKFPSTTICGALTDLEQAFSNFYNKNINAKYPSYKKCKVRSKQTKLPFPERIHGSISVQSSNPKGLQIAEAEDDPRYSTVKLLRIGEVRFRQHRDFPKEYELSPMYARVSKETSGKMYIIFTFRRPLTEPAPLTDTDSFLGVDLSVGQYIAICSDGTKFENPRKTEKEKERLTILSHAIDRKQIGSNNWIKVTNMKAKLENEIARRKRYILENYAKQIVSKADVICIEDLDVVGMKKKPTLLKDDDKDATPYELDKCIKYKKKDMPMLQRNGRLKAKAKIRRMAQDTALGEFVLLLEKEANKQGKAVQKVSRYYPSTQLCYECGHQNTQYSGIENLWKKEFVCEKCGCTKERDVNAAMNLRKEGAELYRKELEERSS